MFLCSPKYRKYINATIHVEAQFAIAKMVNGYMSVLFNSPNHRDMGTTAFITPGNIYGNVMLVIVLVVVIPFLESHDIMI